MITYYSYLLKITQHSPSTNFLRRTQRNKNCNRCVQSLEQCSLVFSHMFIYLIFLNIWTIQPNRFSLSASLAQFILFLLSLDWYVRSNRQILNWILQSTLNDEWFPQSEENLSHFDSVHIFVLWARREIKNFFTVLYFHTQIEARSVLFRQLNRMVCWRTKTK